MIHVIGGGPAGLLCAKEIAYHGKKVTVLEEHEEIGKPVHCAGLVSQRGLEELGVDYKPSVMNECTGTRIYSPSGKLIQVDKKKTQACVLDRTYFDQTIAEEALSEGAAVMKDHRVTKKMGDFLVGADGASSSIARGLGLEREFIRAYQIVCPLKRDPDFVELHFGSWSESFFAWIIPQGDGKCRIGIGVKQGDPRRGLEEFLREKNIQVKVEEHLGGVIPLYDEQPTVFPDKKTLLVGDAAAQVKASTGGGIAIGGFCARIAGEVLGKDMPLEEYSDTWESEFKRELILHRRIHNFLEKMNRKELDQLFTDLIEEGVPELIEKYGDMDRPSSLVKRLIKKPRLVARLGKYLNLLTL